MFNGLVADMKERMAESMSIFHPEHHTDSGDEDEEEDDAALSSGDEGN